MRTQGEDDAKTRFRISLTSSEKTDSQIYRLKENPPCKLQLYFFLKLIFRGKLMALRQFIKEGFRPPAILFTETKERCQRIMGELLYDGINAMSLCAAKSPAERQKVIQATRLGLYQN